MGSSPHTRGLLGPQRPDERVTGIIPAHAGFTCWPGWTSPAWGDHPRTRGVYGPGGLDGGAETGSSPHTRGLRTRTHEPRHHRGIIPAHAGFTEVSHTVAWRGEDHPRTRGVYCGTAARGRATSGSSPHTRGLPPCAGPHSPGGGIIPAHAGFTSHRDQRHGDLTDHPRTRGVYSHTMVSAHMVGGSSPHTRGLPGQALGTPQRDGIIPAHAGFTP